MITKIYPQVLKAITSYPEGTANLAALGGVISTIGFASRQIEEAGTIGLSDLALCVARVFYNAAMIAPAFLVAKSFLNTKDSTFLKWSSGAGLLSLGLAGTAAAVTPLVAAYNREFHPDKVTKKDNYFEISQWVGICTKTAAIVNLVASATLGKLDISTCVGLSTLSIVSLLIDFDIL